MSASIVRPHAAPVKPAASAPFAAVPHDLAADPRLTPVDVRIIAALLFWARGKAACWPCDRSIAGRVGRSTATVQRALRRLEGLGLIARERVEPSDRNRTGRVIRLLWRVDHPCATPRSSASAPPRSPVSDEGEKGREGERPGSDDGPGSPPPPAGDERELWHTWAAGADATLARFGRLALAAAGETEIPPHPIRGSAIEFDPVVGPRVGFHAHRDGLAYVDDPGGEARGDRAVTGANEALPPPLASPGAVARGTGDEDRIDEGHGRHPGYSHHRAWASDANPTTPLPSPTPTETTYAAPISTPIPRETPPIPKLGARNDIPISTQARGAIDTQPRGHAAPPIVTPGGAQVPDLAKPTMRRPPATRVRLGGLAHSLGEVFTWPLHRRGVAGSPTRPGASP